MVKNSIMTPEKNIIYNWQREATFIFGRGTKRILLQEILNTAIQFGITNTGSCATINVWTFLHYHLTIAQTQSTYSIKKVQNPHRRPCFDIHILSEMTPGLSKLLYLTYRDWNNDTPHLFNQLTNQPWEADKDEDECFPTKMWRIDHFNPKRDIH